MSELSATPLPPLDRVGGALCLDFTNTINSRLAPSRDEIATPEGLADWLHRSGLLVEAAATAAATPIPADLVANARHRRETIHRVFATLAAGRDPDQDDIAAVARGHADALAAARLGRVGRRFEPAWSSNSADDALRAVDHSAGSLLLSDDLDRLKACPGCGWLFLDQSRNRSRRWCDMATCGSRDKMRRYYRTRVDRTGSS